MTERADLYHIVVNDEEQYSVWPEEAVLPAGWTTRGAARSKAECLAEIDTLWTDLRPRSLREHLAAQGTAVDGGR
ncbi:MbtH family protein [Streptomyces sp. NPDC052301]|uniref:MbtH family protein n=1 Tax=Streptomyces sp. NPDC052301 TaxID=3365687 RepID=UPI0037D1C384